VTDDDEPATDSPRRPISRPSIRRITRPSMLLDLQEGTPVGEYEIQAQIGEGAMGTVYSAVHPLIGKTVAVKVLKPELCSNQATIDRFVQEAQAVNKIGHPNIVDVFSLGELTDGRAYMIMEWLRGEDLRTRLSRGRSPSPMRATSSTASRARSRPRTPRTSSTATSSPTTSSCTRSRTGR
jgi:serine/threonine-protein kinase